MDAEQVKTQFEPLMERCKRDEDKIMVLHVSKVEDIGTCMYRNIDQGDAIMLIQRLVTRFKIHPVALLQAIYGSDIEVIHINKDDNMDNYQRHEN